MNKKSLKIGYLWQNDAAKMSTTAAAALHIKAVVRGFEQRGHQVRMVATAEDSSGLRSDDLTHWQPVDIQQGRSNSLRMVERAVRGTQSRLHLPYINFFDSYRFADACVDSLGDYDVLYERYWFLNYGGLIAAKRLNIPLVLEINGDLIEEYRLLNIKLSKAQWAAIRLLNRWLFREADHVIAVSEPLRKRTLEQWRFSPEKITTVANGVHIDLFANGATESTPSISQRYELEGKPVVIFVGGFQPWHSIDILVDAFQHVASANTEVKLVLVGDGPQRSDIEKQVHDLGIEHRVLFTGQVSHQDVADLLKTAQIAVLSHRLSNASISFSPLKLFEYMAAGKAIVASTLPNIQEVITHQKTGILVPPDDPKAIADALVNLLGNEEQRHNLGQAARQQALKRYSWEQTVIHLESILYDLVQDSNSVKSGHSV